MPVVPKQQKTRRLRMRRARQAQVLSPQRIIAILLLLILLVYFRNQSSSSSKDILSSLRGSGSKTIGADHGQWVKPDAQPFNEHDEVKNANHLIMVAGHSVTVSGHLYDADVDETDWFLLPYQKGRGLPQTIIAHIREGIRQAAIDPRSILIFSGGETRASTGPVNEGTSYFRVADAMDLWKDGIAKDKNVRARTISEEFATDSFQNLLFSICRFREITGSYPDKITTVSFSFKQTRFETMHSNSLLWPSEHFHYVGIDPDASTGFDIGEATKGELENAAKPFDSDPYGCHTEVLLEKRRMRNPFHRTPPYELTCPEMKELLHWCGPDIISSDKVPW